MITPPESTAAHRVAVVRVFYDLPWERGGVRWTVAHESLASIINGPGAFALIADTAEHAESMGGTVIGHESMARWWVDIGPYRMPDPDRLRTA